jgi:SAM-dependent methyltransferase
LATAFQLTALSLLQHLARQRLPRTPERTPVTDDREKVAQYGDVLATKLALANAAAIELAYRAQPVVRPGTALDLACWPGHFTLCLARYLGYRHVRGVDLSQRMVEAATQNAARSGLGQRAENRPALPG